MARRLVSFLLLIVFVAGCAPAPLPAKPALWLVRDESGHKGWLFGTIHALPQPVAWQTQTVKHALDQAGMIVVEVTGQGTQGANALFNTMAHSPGLAPIGSRVSPGMTKRLNDAIRHANMTEKDFAEIKTWAAALILSRAQQSASDAARSVDLGVTAAAGKRPVSELEGIAAQLTIFDRLPEASQQALLQAAISGEDSQESAELVDAWRHGDMAAIERETTRGILAIPELRDALLIRRNEAWAKEIASMIRDRKKPFVAVGAAHMAGDEGLPELLRAEGFTISRIQ